MPSFRRFAACGRPAGCRCSLPGIGAAIAVVTGAIDLGVFGVDLPIFKRQVNDAWLRRYRGWVYGAGFGWQIGLGVATYIMTAGILLMISLAVLTASPLAALIIALTFGLVRGSAVYVGRSATTPAKLADVHAQLDRLGPFARWAALWVQVVAAAVLAAVTWHPLVGVAVVLLAAGTFAGRVVRQPASAGAAPATSPR